jgi:hypothetical protein
LIFESRGTPDGAWAGFSSPASFSTRARTSSGRVSILSHGRSWAIDFPAFVALTVRFPLTSLTLMS